MASSTGPKSAKNSIWQGIHMRKLTDTTEGSIIYIYIYIYTCRSHLQFRSLIFPRRFEFQIWQNQLFKRWKAKLYIHKYLYIRIWSANHIIYVICYIWFIISSKLCIRCDVFGIIYYILYIICYIYILYDILYGTRYILYVIYSLRVI